MIYLEVYPELQRTLISISFVVTITSTTI